MTTFEIIRDFRFLKVLVKKICIEWKYIVMCKESNQVDNSAPCNFNFVAKQRTVQPIYEPKRTCLFTNLTLFILCPMRYTECTASIFAI